MKIIKQADLTEDFFSYADFAEIPVVRKILDEVRHEGDDAVRRYTKQFDNMDKESYLLSAEEINDCYNQVSSKTIESLRYSARNIEAFSQKQFAQLRDFEVIVSNNVLGQRVIPLKSVGCYVPAGRYPLASTALMTVIPAKVAGVKDIIVCSPKINPVTVVASDISGATKIYSIGGVQAIGAMAYGTRTVTKVSKIVGPGNAYVTGAKKSVFGAVGIDFVAGPSEVMIIADESCEISYVAADVLAQAEHDPMARSDVIVFDEKLALAIKNEIKNQLVGLLTREVAEKALENSSIVVVDSVEDAAVISNKRSPEHLQLCVKDVRKVMSLFTSYGSLFLGNNSAEVFGDFCSGTNHALPTNGAAHYCGGLSVFDYVRIITHQEITVKGLADMVKHGARFGEIEGLDAHKKAALRRG